MILILFFSRLPSFWFCTSWWMNILFLFSLISIYTKYCVMYLNTFYALFTIRYVRLSSNVMHETQLKCGTIVLILCQKPRYSLRRSKVFRLCSSDRALERNDRKKKNGKKQQTHYEIYQIGNDFGSNISNVFSFADPWKTENQNASTNGI